MSLKTAILVATAVFLLTLLVRLPAAVLPRLLPQGVQCQAPSGTLWQGTCGQLSRGNFSLSSVRWNLHPWALLHARLTLDIASDDARAPGSARLSLHANGDIDIEALNAQLPLQSGFGLPAGWRGQLLLAVASAKVRGGHLAALQGVVTAQHLHSEHPVAELGAFELTFPAAPDGATMVGTLRDLDGPLALQGRLQLTPQGSYELSGSVVARETASPDLQQMLQLLGPPDAQGRRSFALSGAL